MYGKWCIYITSVENRYVLLMMCEKFSHMSIIQLFTNFNNEQIFAS